MKLNVAVLLLLFVIAGFQTSHAQLGVSVIQKSETANRALYRLKHNGRFFECRLNLNSNKVAVNVRLGNGTPLFSGRMNARGYQSLNGCPVLAEAILLWLLTHVDTEDPKNIDLIANSDVPSEYDTTCLQNCIDQAKIDISDARTDQENALGNPNSLGQHCTPIFIDDIERIATDFITCIDNCRI